MAMNAYGGVAGGFSSERIDPVAPWGGVMPSGGYAPGGGAVNIPTAAQANATNLAYSRGAMLADPIYATAQGLLNANDPLAMRDVARQGAEHAVGTGMVGSGAAGQYTGRLRQYDIERRAALGNQLLSGAYSRTPAPVNPYAQAQLQMQANAENNQLLSQIQSRYAPSGFSQGGGGGGGGGRSAPMIIGGGGGGGAPAAPAYRPLQPFQGGGTPAGSDQVAYGFGGEGWNAVNQRSQFYPGEYEPGTISFGEGSQLPMPTPTFTGTTEADSGDEDWWDF